MKGPNARLASLVAIAAAVLFCLDVYVLYSNVFWFFVSRPVISRSQALGLRSPVEVDARLVALNLICIGCLVALLRRARAGIIAADPRPASAALTLTWLIPFRMRDEISLGSLWTLSSPHREPPPVLLRLWYWSWSIALTGTVLFDLLISAFPRPPYAVVLAYCPIVFAHLVWCFTTVPLFEGLARLRDEAERVPTPASEPLRRQVPAPRASPAGACLACGAAARSSRCAVCGAAMAVGHYRVRAVLRSSPARRTYQAVSPEGRLVALKELVFAKVPDAAELEAFEREAGLLRGLRHRRIPQYLDAFVEGEGPATRFYLASQWIEGISLAEELDARTYQADEVFACVAELLQILVYLHGLSPPVLHCDIKPGNVVRTPDGRLSLLDFGTARNLETTWQSGTMVGTVGYMPPEQLAGQVDLTSDLYAVGATALHLLTHSPPWQFMDGPQLRLPRLAISSGYRRVLERLVHPQRQRRFASARNVLRALAEVRPADMPAYLKSSG
jgi:hypothetical protein